VIFHVKKQIFCRLVVVFYGVTQQSVRFCPATPHFFPTYRVDSATILEEAFRKTRVNRSPSNFTPSSDKRLAPRKKELNNGHSGFHLHPGY
jgi:hypothetical protein